MLTELRIRNFTIVKELSFIFEKGMSALTGETGAGKSILIDAIQLVLGERADIRFIREGEERCEISLCFDVEKHPSAQQWLSEYDLNQGNDCLIRRTINRDGRSRCYVNDQIVSLQRVKALGTLLLTIHGQHHNQLLLDSSYQRQQVDSYVADFSLLKNVKQHYQSWQSLLKAEKKLQQSLEESQAKIDFLNYQLNELAALQLVPGEVGTLEADQKQLAHMDQLLSDGRIAFQKIVDSSSELFKAQTLLKNLCGFAESLKNVVVLLEEASIQVEESHRELASYLEKLSVNPEQLQCTERRLSDIYVLARKYRVSPDELPSLQSKMQQELDALNTLDVESERLHLEIKAVKLLYEQSALQVSEQRLLVAKTMTDRVQAYLPELGMTHARFIIKLVPSTPSENGLECVEFWMSTNLGQPLQPLEKIISGGELSRLNLAIQAIFAKEQAVPVLIFDEIDTGIGGGVASLVGQLMRFLSEKTQVITITHLPQVAVKAHQHYMVRKELLGGETYTQLYKLDVEDRTLETARMLGGLKITDRTMAHARELLECVDEGQGEVSM
jgi:DNA repair protein RecN (Recombination protein N)